MSKLNNRNFVIRAKRGLAADLAGLSGNLYEGEFAYTTDDNKLYVGDGSGDPVEVGGGGSGSPGGSDTQVQYNNAGTFGGAANWTHSGGNLNIALGGKLLYGGGQIIQAQPSLSNFYEGGAGNLTATGANNLATGFTALASLTTGNNNTAAGVQALFNTLTGQGNTGVGLNALYSNTSGSNNFALGTSALFANTDGSNNVAIGSSALVANVSGQNNVGIGRLALTSVTGSENVGIGQSALSGQTSGTGNTVIGNNAMPGAAPFNNCVGIGASVLNSCTGDNNTAIGVVSGLNLTTGTKNTIVGYNTGQGITTGSNNTIVGSSVSGLSSTLADAIILADGAGTIRFDYNKTTTGFTTISGGSWNMRLPSSAGTANHFLQTDGSGNTTWAAGGGGGTPGGSSGEIQYNNAGIFGGLTDAQVATRVETLIATATALTSIQGRTVTLADAGADALLGWDDSASAYQNLSAADAKTALGLGTTDSPQFAAINHGNASDTTVARQGAGVLAVEGKMIYATGTVALTDGATPALDAALGSTFTLSAAGDRTIAVPSNAQAGQKIVIAHTASGANRTLALNTGAGGFRFGTDVTGLTLTTSGLTDYIGAIYNATASRWDVVAYVKGY